jgi:hypothetical protein
MRKRWLSANGSGAVKAGGAQAEGFDAETLAVGQRIGCCEGRRSASDAETVAFSQ